MLTDALRAARPVASDALRLRVSELASTAPPRRPSPFARLSLRRLTLVAVPVCASAAIAAAVIGGLARPEGAQRTVLPGAYATTGEASGDRDALQQQALAPSAKAGTATSDTAPAPTPGRLQRYSAQLTVAVEDNEALSKATQSALATARSLGGYVVSVDYATGDTGSASMTLRVPTAKVQDAIVRLSGLGRIVTQQVQIDDLQGSVDELTKRENALRERVARLSARLASPGVDPETRATLEARRDAARSELAQVRTQRAQVTGEARFATVQLSLQTERDASVAPVPSRFDRAIDRAGQILAWEASAVLYALVVLGPLALLALAVWLIRRGWRRRETEQLLGT
jgi:hypothetical protein